ncbi:hypothetical protein HPB47_002973 [Ixodes persulcatus]|uniref:Uncharacterized protein n=1 Tax=Ixodes persulcatus TaxID=34615 RepID=A0AC60PLD2_IXOPE|nr:hypothetical protein HPB47_002973 [Ixodes persulcatus]
MTTPAAGVGEIYDNRIPKPQRLARACTVESAMRSRTNPSLPAFIHVAERQAIFKPTIPSLCQSPTQNNDVAYPLGSRYCRRPRDPEHVPAPVTLFPTMSAFTADEAENKQLMAAFLHRNMAMMMTKLANQANQVQGTTLPDLSALLPTFTGGSNPPFKRWIEELERTQRLAR